MNGAGAWAGAGDLAVERQRLAPGVARPLVTIVVNNHNYGAYLRDAIDSALTQHYRPLEVVVVDDGSTDDSRAIIASYGDRVVPVLKPRGGQASTFSAGLERSTGSIVLFLDADDALLPTAIEDVVAAWRPGVAKVQFRYAFMGADGRDLGVVYPGGELPSGDLRDWVVEHGRYPSPGTCGNAFARSVLDAILPIADCRSPDGYLVLASALLGEVVSLDRVLCRVRVHGDNAWSMDRFSVERVRDYALHDVENERLLRPFAAQRGMTLPARWTLRSAGHVQARVASLKLAPAEHPFPNDGMARLVVGGLGAFWRAPQAPLRRRLLGATWLLLVAMLPRSLARPLIEWSYQPAQRPAVFNRLLGRRR
ncbi:MAG: glycosyltransferase family 2 protein [Longimicrobiales bacterium]